MTKILIFLFFNVKFGTYGDLNIFDKNIALEFHDPFILIILGQFNPKI